MLHNSTQFAYWKGHVLPCTIFLPQIQKYEWKIIVFGSRTVRMVNQHNCWNIVTGLCMKNNKSRSFILLSYQKLSINKPTIMVTKLQQKQSVPKWKTVPIREFDNRFNNVLLNIDIENPIIPGKKLTSFAHINDHFSPTFSPIRANVHRIRALFHWCPTTATP